MAPKKSAKSQPKKASDSPISAASSSSASASASAGAARAVPYEPTAARTAESGEEVAELIGTAVLALEDQFVVSGECRVAGGGVVLKIRKPESASVSGTSNGNGAGDGDGDAAAGAGAGKRGAAAGSAASPKKAPAQKKRKTAGGAAAKGETDDLVTVSLPVPLCNAADWPAAGPGYSAAVAEMQKAGGAYPPFNPTIAALLAAAEASPFGRGGETVLDESVRKAMQIPAARVVEFSFDPVRAGIIDKVHKALVPDAVGLTATLHKINIYGKDGFFASHRDTPLDEAQVGTLVVCLPVGFRGGVFNIKHNGNEVNVDSNWGTDDKEMWVNAPAAVLPWVAFFGHAEHDITPVDAGLRVTATYVLRRQDGGSESAAALAEKSLLDRLIGQTGTVPEQQQQQQRPSKKTQTNASAASASSSAAVSVSCSEPLPLFKATELAGHTLPQLKALCKERKLKVSGTKAELIARLTEKHFMEPRRAMSGGVALMRLLADAQLNAEFLPDGGVVAIPCMHMYESAINLPVDTNTVRQTSKTHLKGADSIVFVAAARLGLSPEVVRCLYSEVDEAWKVLDDPKYANMSLAEVAKQVTCIERVEDSFNARAIDTEDWDGSVNIHKNKGEQVYWAIDVPDSAKEVASGRSPVGLGPLLDEIWTSGTGYFGNEASCGTLYANAVILLRFGAFSSPARKQFAQSFTELSEDDLADALQAFSAVSAGEPAAAEYKIADAQSKKILKVKPKRRTSSHGRRGGNADLANLMMFALLHGGGGLPFGAFGGGSDSDDSMGYGFMSDSDDW